MKRIASRAALGLLVVACGGAAMAQAPAKSPVHVGHYKTLESSDHFKLWLARYTNPILLIGTDVAYAYTLADICTLPSPPPQTELYTDAFAIARKGDTGYDVEKLAQIQKINLCRSKGGHFALLTKTKLENLPGALVITWSAGESVGGIEAPALQRTPSKLRRSSEGTPVATATDFDTKLVLAYRDELEKEGVLVSPISLDEHVLKSRLGVVASAATHNAPAKLPRRQFCLTPMGFSKDSRQTTQPERTCSSELDAFAAWFVSKSAPAPKPSPAPKVAGASTVSATIPSPMTAIPAARAERVDRGDYYILEMIVN